MPGLKEQLSGIVRLTAEVQGEIDDINARQEGIESQLRGHFTCSGPTVLGTASAQLENELSQLPVVDSFPENGIERLDEIELQLAEAAEQRDRLKNEAKLRLEQAATFGGHQDIAKYEVTLQGLVDQREWIAELEQQVAQAQSKYDTLEKQLQEHQPQWGEGHTANPNAEFDITPNAYARLVSKARTFKRAVARREKTKRLGKRLGKLCQSQQEKLAAGLSRYRVESASDALTVVRERLTNMETLGELKLNERELHKRQLSFDELREHTEIRLALPASYYICTWAVTACGGLSVLVGAFQGVMNQITIGGVFVLIGFMLVMLSRLAKHHFEQGVDHRLKEISAAADRNFEELRAVREEILEVLGDAPGKADDGNWLPEADEMRRCAREIADLERLAVAAAQAATQSSTPGKHQQRHLRIAAQRHRARQGWQQLLSQLGLPETLDVAAAFKIWQSLVELSHFRQEFRVAKIELKSRRQMYTSFCRRIAAVGRRMHEWEHDFDQPLAVLDHWEEQLKTLHGGRDDRRRLRREARDLAREAAGFRATVEDYKTQRAALLREAGAADREDFELRSEALTRRRITGAGNSNKPATICKPPAKATTNSPSPKRTWNCSTPHHNSECIELLKMEQEDLRNDLQEAYEKLGGLRRELEVIEADQQSRHLRREISQIQQQIHPAGAEWFALQRAKQAVEQMRHHVERTRQPVTIADASRYLTRITCGKYRNIWTPLGKRSLRIDDEHGHSLSVESLSSGTREQLFLAIRMALIHDYARHGVTLPMVLDDVLVNFDENRTEAAIDALSDFSRQGHQVLMFTCHRHLANGDTNKGREPIWLPSREELRRSRVIGTCRASRRRMPLPTCPAVRKRVDWHSHLDVAARIQRTPLRIDNRNPRPTPLATPATAAATSLPAADSTRPSRVAHRDHRVDCKAPRDPLRSIQSASNPPHVSHSPAWSSGNNVENANTVRRGESSRKDLSTAAPNRHHPRHRSISTDQRLLQFPRLWDTNPARKPGRSQTAPAGVTPGQSTINGSRIPPSYIDPFARAQRPI